MATSRSGRGRIADGAAVKVCVDHLRDLLIDMALINRTGSVLQDVWMHGTVVFHVSTACYV